MKEDYIFPFLWMRDQTEETLRTEMEKIRECGIRSVCVESRPHPDFGGEGWWRDMDIILDEAKKHDMHVWILDDAHFPTGQANGQIPARHPELARKYAMMQHTDCVGPVPAATLDVNLMMTKAFTWMDFGKKIEKPLIDRQELLSVMAYPVVEGDILRQDGVDVTALVKDGHLHWDVPGGVWRICVTFTTYDFGARNEYINYIDRDSVRVLIDAVYELHYRKYAEEFGKTIVGFFSDEPGFYNVDGFDMGDAIGRKKMALPWCDELEPLLEKAMGKNWKAALPFLWMDAEDEAVSAGARLAYMDQVSRLYAKNFTGQIGQWCEDHSVSYIGHVIEDNGEHTRLGSGAGHYFRAVSGQHMAGIDTITGQILPGNAYANRHTVAYVADGSFYHFALAKLGASAAQIDPKKKGRLMCECFGAYGWNFGVKSMKWLTDFLLANGVNHLVPHAFSMADYPDIDCPPHFYARGNNGQFPYFAELMRYANRMCGLFNGGENVPVAALLYPAESDWMQECMPAEVPARELTEHQIDFEIIPEDVFADRAYFGTEVKDGALRINGRRMQVLIVPGTPRADERLLEVTGELQKAGIPVIFVDQKPENISEGEVISRKRLGAALRERGYYDILPISEKERESGKAQGNVAVPAAAPAAQCGNGKAQEAAVSAAQCEGETVQGDAASAAQREGKTVQGDAASAAQCENRNAHKADFCRNLIYYHYRKQNKDYYFLFNTSLSESVHTNVLFAETGRALAYDGMRDVYEETPQEPGSGGVRIPVDLEPYESVIYVFGESKEEKATDIPGLSADDAAAAGSTKAAAGLSAGAAAAFAAGSTEAVAELRAAGSPDSPLPARQKGCGVPQADLLVLDISENWETSRVRAIDYPNFTNWEHVEKLLPVSDYAPEFAGVMCYEKDVELKQTAQAWFEAEHVYEAAELFVNGKSAGKKLTPSYRWDISTLVREGTNHIRLEAANTPTRDTWSVPGPFGPDREITEPSGMFGKVVIKYC